MDGAQRWSSAGENEQLLERQTTIRDLDPRGHNNPKSPRTDMDAEYRTHLGDHDVSDGHPAP